MQSGGIFLEVQTGEMTSGLVSCSGPCNMGDMVRGMAGLWVIIGQRGWGVGGWGTEPCAFEWQSSMTSEAACN